MLFDVKADHGLDHASLAGIEVAAIAEMFGQRLAFGASPGFKGGDELVLVDQTVLQGNQSEEKLAFDVRSHEIHSRSRPDVGSYVSALAAGTGRGPWASGLAL